MERPILATLLKGVFRAALGARPARVDGEVATRGLSRDVTITRDAYGVPSIVASSELDAWFGLGFCHGQDRAGQLEILVRTVRGTLAEIAGRDGLPIDRLARRLGLRRAARAQLANARAEVRAQLDAYARGVNAGTSLGSPSRAHDLVLLGCAPTTFEAEDAQGIMVLLCFALASNWDVELLRLEMLDNDGPEAVRALDAAYPAKLLAAIPPFAPVGPSAHRLADDLRAMGEVAPLGGASNAWAVAGRKTKTGKPILASDPHLEPVVPPHWYLSHMITPSFRVRGASFVGVPAFASGHNEHAAWGLTAAHADNTDLFLEDVGPDGKSVREGDRYVPCEERFEAISIQGEPTIVEHVLVTKRGPLVGAAFDGAGVGLSMSATWLADRPYVGLLRAHHAKSAAEVHELFRERGASAATIVTADVEGRIGIQCSVEIPRRKKGSGLIPMPGWDPACGWGEEMVPFDAMPHAIDPAEGVVVAANNPPQPLDAEPFLGVDFLDGYRHRAIHEALAARDDWDLASTQALQKSLRSIPWEEIKPYVLAVRADGDAARARDLLAAWDGDMSEGSAGASVYAVFLAALARRVVEAKAPKTARRALGEGFNPVLPHNTMIGRRLGHLVELLRDQPPGFFATGWHHAIRDALAESIESLQKHAGPDPARWGWGRVRPIRLQHLFSRVNPLLDRVFGLGPYPFGGDSSTIAQGTVDFTNPLANPIGCANLRMVIDLADLGRSRFALLGGQSGNPLSPHYEDLVEAHRGAGVELAWTADDARARALHTLTLIPIAPVR